MEKSESKVKNDVLCFATHLNSYVTYKPIKAEWNISLDMINSWRSLKVQRTNIWSSAPIGRLSLASDYAEYVEASFETGQADMMAGNWSDRDLFTVSPPQ